MENIKKNCKITGGRYLLTLIALTLISVISCTTQKKGIKGYDEHFYKAMLDYKDHDYEKALSNFDKAIEIRPDENVSAYFYAAASALRLKKEVIAKEHIIQAIEQTNAKQDYFNEFSEFEGFRNLDLFEEINSNYAQYTATFYSNLEHPEIYREMDSLIEADQKVRKNGSNGQEIMKTDSTNVARLIEITDEYGWQNKGWLILWHQRASFNEENMIWNYFKPIINDEIRKGNMRKSYWAQFEEFMNITEREVQVYGLYPHNYEMFPLEDPETVDQRRDSLNLPPLWVMNKVYGWPLPANYAYVYDQKI